MISIIICSRKHSISECLQKNIEDTIGSPYEIICIDNSKGQYGICAAYNEGIKRAHGEFLCFMHEDITFLSKDWGDHGIKHLINPEIAMVGVLGCTFFDQCMSYWCVPPFCVGHNWCGTWHKVFSKQLQAEPVVAVDGLWMLLKKELFDKGYLYWDYTTFHGFDMYDMDISMQVIRRGLKIFIDPAICIDHKSNGNFGPNFYKSSLLFHEKWDYFLPVSISEDITSNSIMSKQFALQTICRLNIEVGKSVCQKMMQRLLRIRRVVSMLISKILK